jgi:Cyclin, N-terminal domain
MYPAINLRMKWSSFDGKSQDVSLLSDQIDVMMDLNRHYECEDYLLFQPQDDQAIDSLARKKMIDWKFRVVDHYSISREVVATSTNLMDRFVSLYACDRMTFKLAAMTSLYMAAKLNDHLQLPIYKLVELSRGEFLSSDVVEMEAIILQTLQWRVHPVTVHSLIHSLVQLVPVSNVPMVAAIYDRAIFFAELCLFDYSYVTKSRWSIAVAAILNALEGIGEGLTTEDSERAFLETIGIHTSVDLSGEHMDHLREDLWYIYSLSAQYQEEDMQMYPPEASSEFEKQPPVPMGNGTPHSPISVVAMRS